MKRIVAILAVVALVGMPVIAGDEAAPAAPAAPAAKEMVLKGKIVKTEAEKEGKNIVSYTLVTADAKIDLPAPKDGIKDDMLNADVEVAVKAVVGADKKIVVKEVTGVKPVAKKEAAK